EEIGPGRSSANSGSLDRQPSAESIHQDVLTHSALPLPLSLHLLLAQPCSVRVNKFDYDHEHEQGDDEAAHWHHTWRLRRDRTGDCRVRSEIGTRSRFD